MSRYLSDPLIMLFVLMPAGGWMLLFQPIPTLIAAVIAVALWIVSRGSYYFYVHVCARELKVDPSISAPFLDRLLAHAGDFALALLLAIVVPQLSSVNWFWAGALTAFYYISCWFVIGGTPGKWAVPLAIVDARTGARPSLWQAVVRYVGYFVSALPLGLGFFWAFRDPRGRMWHDILSNTMVVSPQVMLENGGADAATAVARSGPPATAARNGQRAPTFGQRRVSQH